MSNSNVICNKLVSKDEFLSLLASTIQCIEDHELYTDVVQKDLMIEEIQDAMNRIKNGELFGSNEMLYTEQCVALTDEIADCLRLPEEREDLPGDDE